jgi:hypothetical protein
MFFTKPNDKDLTPQQISALFYQPPWRWGRERNPEILKFHRN